MDIDNAAQPETLEILQCTDFEIDGNGTNQQWQQTEWTALSILDEADDRYETKFKMQYSEKGIYVLAYCEDKIASTAYSENQADLWNGDVFEVFLQTDPISPTYFEYEINQLNAELVLFISNNDKEFMGWAPWHYEGSRMIKKAIKIHGGVAEPNAKISGWTAEFFIPFDLLKGLKNGHPEPGTTWKANFYRIDHDTKKPIKWGWQPIEKSFHEYEKFGTIVFK